MKQFVGSYNVYSSPDITKKLNIRLHQTFGYVKESLAEALKLEDVDEVGYIPLEALIEAISMLDIDVDLDL